MSSKKYFDGKISVITAVYNAAGCVSDLIESLRQQTDKNFEWVVVDALSKDNTLEIINNVKDLNIRLISEADFGIYDALNKGIKASAGEFYLVAGADDIFFPNAIADYKAGIERGVGIVTANLLMGENVIKPGQEAAWKNGHKAYVSNHALGMLTRKNLHEKYGYYSRMFPIAADQLFIQQCASGGEIFKRIDTLVGRFSLLGLSSVDHIGALTESFRIQVMMGRNKWVQYALYILKLLKRVYKLNT